MHDCVGQRDHLRETEISFGIAYPEIVVMITDGFTYNDRQVPLFKKELRHPSVVRSPNLLFKFNHLLS